MLNTASTIFNSITIKI